MANNAEIYKKVELSGRSWIIKKFDSRSGLKMARLVMSKLQPLMPLLAAAEGKDSTLGKGQTYSAAFGILGELSDEDIDSLVDKCLRVCYEDLPAGMQPVMDERGNFGVEGVEYDMGLTLMLCYEAISWGAADFFDENSSISSLFQKLNG